MRYAAIGLGLAISIITAPSAAQPPTVFSASGTSPGAISGAIGTFTSGLGQNNGDRLGTQFTGWRTIAWDEVPDNLSAPVSLPADYFNTAPLRRGAELAFAAGQAGSGFQVSARPGSEAGTPVSFGNINPLYVNEFAPYSNPRLFSPIGTNVTEVHFYLPGTKTRGLSRGFGAVFSDVDIVGSTTISYFGEGGTPLGTWSAEPVFGQRGYSFLGALFNTSIVSFVRIQAGTGALGSDPGFITTGPSLPPTRGTPTVDVVVMDDFYFAEPIPSPMSGAALLVAFGCSVALRRRS